MSASLGQCDTTCNARHEDARRHDSVRGVLRAAPGHLVLVRRAPARLRRLAHWTLLSCGLHGGHLPLAGRARPSALAGLARLGRREEAHREVACCRAILEKQTTQKRDPLLVYRLACVYSITSKTEASDRVIAISLLKESCRAGFRDFSIIEKSEALAPIRELPEFDRFLKAAKELAF